jgi:hypothetical protein
MRYNRRKFRDVGSVAIKTKNHLHCQIRLDSAVMVIVCTHHQHTSRCITTRVSVNSSNSEICKPHVSTTNNHRVLLLPFINNKQKNIKIIALNTMLFLICTHVISDIYKIPDRGSPSFCILELESFQVMLRGPSRRPPSPAPVLRSFSTVPSAQACG